jgi:hypothetical protein
MNAMSPIHAIILGVLGLLFIVSRRWKGANDASKKS